MKLVSIMIFYIILLSFKISINVKVKNLTKLKKEGADPERIPGVNIHVEYNDLDPANTKKYDSERFTNLERIRDMEVRLNAEKNYLETLLMSQSAKLNEITQLAMTTYNILESVSSKKYNRPEIQFRK